MINVVLVSHSKTLVGGSEKSLLEIARFLHAQSGFQVHVVVPGNGPLTRQLINDGISTKVISYSWAITTSEHEFPNSINTNLSLLPKIEAYLSSVRADIVITNNSVVPWFAYVAKRMGLTHLWFIRELVYNNGSFYYYPNPDETMRFISENSDVVLTNSETMRKRLSKELHRTNDIEVIYPTINKEILNVTPMSPIKSTSLIVYGAISEQKNQLEAIHAVEHLKHKYPDLSLTIMGKPSSHGYLARLKAYIADNNLEGYVRIIDHSPAPYKEVVRHALCIVPSRFEPFGRVTVESMLLKRLVIGADTGGTKELIGRSKQYGLLYPLGDIEKLSDAIDYAISNQAAVGRIVENAYAFAKQHFLDHTSHQDLIKILQSARHTNDRKGHTFNWIDQLLFDNTNRLLKANQEIVDYSKKIDALQIENSAIGEALQTKEVQYSTLLNSRRVRLANRFARLNKPLVIAKTTLSKMYKLYLLTSLWSYETISSPHNETPDNTPVVPVVICMWNRLDRLPKIFHLLDKQADVKVDLYIWNNSHLKQVVNQALYDDESYMKGALQRISIKHSLLNVGGFGRFFYARRLKKKYPYVLFLDDDQDISTDFIKQCLARQEPRSLKSVWAFKINGSYWDRQKVGDGQAADYCGTGGMLCDSSIFSYSRVFRCPQKYWFMEDLWLSFSAKSLGWKLEGLAVDFAFVEREKDQGLHLVNEKDNFYDYLSSIWLPSQNSK